MVVLPPGTAIGVDRTKICSQKRLVGGRTFVSERWIARAPMNRTSGLQGKGALIKRIDVGWLRLVAGSTSRKARGRRQLVLATPSKQLEAKSLLAVLRSTRWFISRSSPESCRKTTAFPGQPGRDLRGKLFRVVQKHDGRAQAWGRPATSARGRKKSEKARVRTRETVPSSGSTATVMPPTLQLEKSPTRRAHAIAIMVRSKRKGDRL